MEEVRPIYPRGTGTRFGDGKEKMSIVSQLAEFWNDAGRGLGCKAVCSLFCNAHL